MSTLQMASVAHCGRTNDFKTAKKSTNKVLVHFLYGPYGTCKSEVGQAEVVKNINKYLKTKNYFELQRYLDSLKAITHIEWKGNSKSQGIKEIVIRPDPKFLDHNTQFTTINTGEGKSKTLSSILEQVRRGTDIATNPRFRYLLNIELKKN